MVREKLAELGDIISRARGAQHATGAWIGGLLDLALDPLAPVDPLIRAALDHAGWCRTGGVGVATEGAELLAKHLGLRCRWNGVWEVVRG